MTAAVLILVALLIAVAWLLALQRKRNQRNLEDTQRLRAMHRWSNVLEGERGSESYEQYRERKHR